MAHPDASGLVRPGKLSNIIRTLIQEAICSNKYHSMLFRTILFCAHRRRLKFGLNNINNLVEFIFNFGTCNPMNGKFSP